MTKVEFCYELFRYISNGINELILETNNFVYSFDVNKDNIFIGQDHFKIMNKSSIEFKVKYNDVRSISRYVD